VLLYSAYCNWLQFVTSCLFHSVCVSLRGLRSYAVTYVNFKVLYIGRENDVIFTPCLWCSIQNGVGRCDLIQMVDIKWHVFQWTKGVQPFYGKVSHLFLWVGSQVAGVKIKSGVRKQLNYCGWRPRVADPSRKRNCTLNRSLGTLQLSRAPLIVNAVPVAKL